MGVSRVPRGPRSAARQSPAGLTARQTEVLGLLADGLTYRQIAERLYVSAKTVDHHVSAVRVKLDARTRAGAVAAARRLGILPAEDGAGGDPT
jgi:DNA-binding CsgD family transcriptional regulator